MPINFLVQLAIGITLAVLSYALTPKPKQPKPPSVDDFKDPTVDAGRPIPVGFGSVTISGLNVLWFGDKSITEHKYSGGKKG